ncbi:PTS sugar transporter subunit IIB [Lactiplantibacillus daoliensis]|uniref:PTS sugar transporter subunit IIB n=1 Tax=Lactiplantibacillus daoliensis TaxID=2559916 RepID=A0ABW1UHA8_9LACO|nr:PTS sugar transporter subunit IIB [Lactiplantibacillus daoliensis]
MKNILLICGSGASSGFMAAAIRKAAKKAGIEVSVKASSESQLDDRIDTTDILLIGPHLSYMVDDLKKEVGDRSIKIAVIPQAIYGSLNGPKALELIQQMEG